MQLEQEMQLSHLAVGFVSSWERWLSPQLGLPGQPLVPRPPGACQRMEPQSPVSTDVCFSDQLEIRAWGGVWEGGGSEEAMRAPGATVCPFVWTGRTLSYLSTLRLWVSGLGS